MPPQKPTIGRMVIYNTSDQDRKLMEYHPSCNVQKQLPATMVAVWSDTCVNLKVNCDGNLELWKTSVNLGEGECSWSWPVISK